MQQIYPEVRRVGAQLAAITPGKKSLPENHPLTRVTAEIGVGSEEEGRSFPVLWDQGNRVAELYGLKHDFSAATKDLYKAAAIDIEAINGPEAGWTLPLASTYIIDNAGIVRHAVVTADWRIRPDPSDTLKRLKELAGNRP